MMPLKYLLGLFCVLILNSSLQAQNSIPFVVVLDAGHGGKDGGAVGSKAVEKKIALKIVLELGLLLERSPSNIKVYYTRKKDVFIPLEERSEIANKKNADLFISIHCNASLDGSAHAQGSETFVLGGNQLARSAQMKALIERENKLSIQVGLGEGQDGRPSSSEKHILASLCQGSIQKNSLILAGLIEDKFKRSCNRKSRGVKQAGFIVLKNAQMPAVLVEAGFLTNPSDQQFLLGARNQKLVAAAIYKAILNYRGKTTFDGRRHRSLAEQDYSTPKEEATNNRLNKERQIEVYQPLSYVQLASSITKFDLTIARWRRYKGQIQCIYFKGRYRCVSMRGGTRNEAANLLKGWKQKGFSGAFIVRI